MELDEVIRLTKKALENVNPDKRVHTEIRFTVEQVKQLLEWLEDYKRLQSVRSWIPRSERMPDEDSYKWAVGITSTGRCIAFQEHNAYENDTGGISVPTYLAHGSEITHWMPIPEPPKEV